MDQDLKYLKESFGITEIDANSLSPLMLAYVGDAVYEVVIRAMLLKTGGSTTKKINREAIKYVSAPAQAESAERIKPHLTEKETEILRRGRNAHSATTAKNATVSQYRKATGFEALMGYLFLTDDIRRMTDLIKIAVGGDNKDKDTP